MQYFNYYFQFFFIIFLLFLIINIIYCLRIISAKGGGLDAGQELLTLGLANLLGSFVSSMPVTGSFSRSAVNHASGVATPLGGIYTGTQLLPIIRIAKNRSFKILLSRDPLFSYVYKIFVPS